MMHKIIPPGAQKVFDGVIFDVYQLKDGGTYEYLKRPDTVQIIAITEDNKLIRLEENQNGSGHFTCVPGGRVEEDEDPLVAAKRELLEETGYEGGDWFSYDSFYPFAKIEWEMFIFIANGVKRVQEPSPDEGEDIKVLHLTFDEFITSLKAPLARDWTLLARFLRKEDVSSEGFSELKKRLGV